MHLPPLGPVKPSMHSQLEMAVLAFFEKLYSGQEIHFAVPVTFLYLPAQVTHKFQDDKQHAGSALDKKEKSERVGAQRRYPICMHRIQA
jgi:hypothetical protein